MSAHEYNRAKIVDANFTRFLSEWNEAVPARSHDKPVRADSVMTGHDLVEVLESQMMARHLDLVARELRSSNASFYTIGSAGHEGNAVLGRLTRVTDPAFLHYRSGGFMMERSRKDPSIDSIYDTVLSIVASADDPISGGRHKVWGSRPLWVLPQTSTIASHVPKAVGMAVSVKRAAKLGVDSGIPADSVVVCSFGDASANHSTALGAFNSAAWASYQKFPMPILLVCEDNGLGISVRTPREWIERTYESRSGMEYFRADGIDVVSAYQTIDEAVRTCRERAVPVFLHLRVVRLLGHAGTDIEATYRERREIEETEAKDPLLMTARTALEAGILDSGRVLEMYEGIRERVAEAAERATKRPKLESRAQVLAPLAPHNEDEVMAEARRSAASERRTAAFALEGTPESRGPKHLAALINWGLHDLLTKYPEALIFGEDVAKKGGVYHVTSGLFERFRGARVFNTLLDEQTILGMAQGAGYLGMLPIPEIQYLAYFHNAGDQIRGEACSTQFFSKDQFRNPMVMRIAALAYQKGFGGHFHNDNSFAALRDIPGLIIACPSRGDDAVAMMRTAMAMARVDGRIVAFLEPIALYMTKDLHKPKDKGWSFEYPPEGEAIALGEARAYHEDAKDLLIITYGNGAHMSLRAARILGEKTGAKVRVLDLRWLNPLPEAAILEHAAACSRVLVVDEGRRTGGISEAVLAVILENLDAPPRSARVVGADTYIPLGPAAELMLPSVDEIVERATTLLG